MNAWDSSARAKTRSISRWRDSRAEAISKKGLWSAGALACVLKGLQRSRGRLLLHVDLLRVHSHWHVQDVWFRRDLSLPQGIGRRAGSDSGKHRSLAVLAAEVIAADGKAELAGVLRGQSALLHALDLQGQLPAGMGRNIPRGRGFLVGRGAHCEQEKQC